MDTIYKALAKCEIPFAVAAQEGDAAAEKAADALLKARGAVSRAQREMKRALAG